MPLPITAMIIGVIGIGGGLGFIMVGLGKPISWCLIDGAPEMARFEPWTRGWWITITFLAIFPALFGFTSFIWGFAQQFGPLW